MLCYVKGVSPELTVSVLTDKVCRGLRSMSRFGNDDGTGVALEAGSVFGGVLALAALHSQL